MFWPNGSAASGQVISFTLVGNSFTSNEIVLSSSYQVTTNGLGAFSIALWCNDEGQAPTLWSCTLPGGESFRFVLEYGSGAAVTLSTLRTTSAAYASSRQALYAQLDQRYALLGSQTGPITDHGQLTGLTDDDHPQYLNQARADARYSNVVHAHTGYSSVGHTHDDRYYTESEVDAKLVEKATVGHTHINGADRTYRHVQSAALAIWTVAHNLGKRVAVSVVDSAGDVVIGDCRYDSDNQVTLTFSAAFSGEAYCN